MRIQGQFEVEVDESEFEEYAFRFGDQRPSDKTIAENFIASLLLGMYRGGTTDSAEVIVTRID